MDLGFVDLTVLQELLEQDLAEPALRPAVAGEDGAGEALQVGDDENVAIRVGDVFRELPLLLVRELLHAWLLFTL